MWTQKLKTSISSYRGPLAIIILFLLAAASSGAQIDPQSDETRLPELTGVRLKTGLMNFATGQSRMIAATVTEVGAATARSRVTIAFFGPGDTLIARHEADLTRASEVTFSLPLHMSGPLALVRAEFTAVGPRARRSKLVVALEDVDMGSLAIEPRVYCSPPTTQTFEPVVPNCPPGVIEHFVLGQ